MSNLILIVYMRDILSELKSKKMLQGGDLLKKAHYRTLRLTRRWSNNLWHGHFLTALRLVKISTCLGARQLS